MFQQRTELDQQQTCCNNQQNRTNNRHAPTINKRAVPTDRMSLILQQPTDMPLILKQTTDMRQRPADMPLILKQTTSRHITHIATNKQQTCHSYWNKQQTDMSQQIGCRSEWCIVPIQLWGTTVNFLSPNGRPLDSPLVWYCARPCWDWRDYMRCRNNNRIGSTTDMPEQRTESDQQQTCRNSQQTCCNNEQNRINNRHAATTNRIGSITGMRQ
jgi:hypothetical protein